MSAPEPTRPDPFIHQREPWSLALVPVVLALVFGLIGFVLAVRL